MASTLSLQTSDGGTRSHMFLSELREGSTGPIMIMVCRKWDVTSVNGRYMSTDYIVTDIKVVFLQLFDAYILSWLVMGLGMTVACISKSLVYVLSNKIGRRAGAYTFFLFLFHVFFSLEDIFFNFFLADKFCQGNNLWSMV
ncbi:hypothetical protein Hanom_Chr09g00766631 [Helianthus anomalus]